MNKHKFLLENHENMTVNEIAEALGSNPITVRSTCYRLKISCKTAEVKKRIDYSKEDAFILENHKEMSAKEMAKELGKSISFINNRRVALDLSQSRKKAYTYIKNESEFFDVHEQNWII